MPLQSKIPRTPFIRACEVARYYVISHFTTRKTELDTRIVTLTGEHRWWSSCLYRYDQRWRQSFNHQLIVVVTQSVRKESHVVQATHTWCYLVRVSRKSSFQQTHAHTFTESLPQSKNTRVSTQWLKCKIRGGGTLHSGSGPWQWSCAFP